MKNKSKYVKKNIRYKVAGILQNKPDTRYIIAGIS